MLATKATDRRRGETAVSRLNKLLRIELAAASAYDRALDHLRDPACREAASKNRLDHVTRAVFLSQVVRRLGGHVLREAGPLGTFARVIEGAAAVFGDRALVWLLAEGEEQLLERYRNAARGLDEATQRELRDHGLWPQEVSKARVEQAAENLKGVLH